MWSKDEKKNGEGKQGKYLEKENIWSAEEKKESFCFIYIHHYSKCIGYRYEDYTYRLKSVTVAMKKNWLVKEGREGSTLAN